MYNEMMNYQLFLGDIVKQQSDLDRFVNECYLITESNNNARTVEALNESFTNTAKDMINKIVGFLMKLWNKFVETTNTLIKSDKQYLDRYKDIILKKKPISCTYTMYNYAKGIPIMIKTNVPPLNYQAMAPDLKDKDTFISKYFPTIINGVKPPYDNFSDIVKSVFRGGGEIKVDSQDLNMTDLFNYCYTYDKIKQYIQKDITTIQNSANNATNEVRKLEGESKIQSEPQQQNNNQQQPNNNQQNQQHEGFDMMRNLFGSGVYYSNVYESYITEEDNSNTNTQQNRDLNTSGNGGSNDINDKSNPAKAYRQINPQQQKQNQDKTQGVNADSVNANNGNAKQAIDDIKVYLNTCTAFVTAKQTCAENAYKTYMSIIRAHVADYVNQNPKTTTSDQSKTADVGTNYNPQNGGNNQQQPNNNQQQQNNNQQ